MCFWWAQMESNHRPHAYQACALTNWAMSPQPSVINTLKIKQCFKNWVLFFSLERRWSSRTFRYGYLVTTSPQSPSLPSTAASLRLAHRLRVFSTLMAWRAVCTRPENVFTAVCWPAITSNSIFIQSNFRLQSELRRVLGFCSTSRFCFPLFSPL